MAYDKKKIPEIKAKIVELVAKGKSLKAVLDNNSEMPSRAIVYQWINDKHEKYDESFLNNYVQARVDRADAIFEECLAIADNQEKDVYITEDGKELTNHNVINRSRLRVDTRKWMLGKLNPKKYGDKMQQDIVIDDKRAKIDEVFPSTEELTKDEEE